MRLKLFVLAGLVFISLITLIGIVNAATCSDAQKIMKLFSPTNSHAATWNYQSTTDYLYEICSPNGETINHGCTTSILWMFDNVANDPEYNSHVSTTQGNGYTIPVCFDGLTCAVRQNTCNADETAILSLFSTTNSHLSAGNDPNYLTKICCKSGVSGALTGAYWADMRGTQISSADLNDRVKLMVAGEGMEGTNIDYEIWKDIKFWFDTKVASSSTLGFTTWRATPGGDYYFKASIDGKVTWLQSGELVVSGIADNSPPVANILTPVVGDIYYTNENIQFTQDSYDVDDDITTQWDFGDTTTSTQYNTVHSYSTRGQKQTKLTVTDDRGLVDTDQTSVLIIDLTASKYVFAHIDYPPWGENIEGYEIPFDASSSYAIETTNCATTCTINCLAGGCKTLTHPEGQTILNAPASYNNLMFSWIFDAGVSGVYNHAGDAGKAFTWIFGTAGEHTASLEVEYNV